jgi:hypothetical protein
MISLQKYATAKDHCCIGYFGPDKSILRELITARPTIETILPGIKVYIACRAEFINLVPNLDMMIPSNELKSRIHDFAYFTEIRADGSMSPVKQLLDGIRSEKMELQKMVLVSR